METILSYAEEQPDIPNSTSLILTSLLTQATKKGTFINSKKHSKLLSLKIKPSFIISKVNFIIKLRLMSVKYIRLAPKIATSVIQNIHLSEHVVVPLSPDN